jgi:hypothetical protein
MAIRLYVAEFFYDPLQNCNFPATRDYAPEYHVLAERNRNNRNPGSKCILLANMTDAQHTAAVADARITHLPLERVVGQIADDADTVGDIPAVARNAVRNRLEALGIDLSDVQLSWTIQRFLREMRDRIHALQAQEPVQ